jgi:hypothetical protein
LSSGGISGTSLKMLRRSRLIVVDISVSSKCSSSKVVSSVVVGKVSSSGKSGNSGGSC